MGVLLRKIQSPKAADSADSRKVSYKATSGIRKDTETLRIYCVNESFPQCRQSMRIRQTLQGDAFHKPINPQPDIGNISHDPKAKLVSLAVQSGIFEQGYLLGADEIMALVPPCDWRDVAHCTNDELRTWATALAMRAVRFRSKVPRGWDKIANCGQCGWVYSFVTGDCLACPWCELKHAGIWFPTPNRRCKLGKRI